VKKLPAARKRKAVEPDKWALDRDRNIGYLMRDTSRLLLGSLSERLDGYGVSLGNWFILRELFETDGLVLRELAARLHLLSPSVVAAVDILEKRGLVQRQRSETDRRQVHVFLTKKGRQLKKPLGEVTGFVAAIGLEGIEEEDLTHLRATLHRIRENCRRDHLSKPL
jgi:MarR family transcriptional regulator, organic hydroperoxide resistance regulator